MRRVKFYAVTSLCKISTLRNVVERYLCSYRTDWSYASSCINFYASFLRQESSPLIYSMVISRTREGSCGCLIVRAAQAVIRAAPPELRLAGLAGRPSGGRTRPRVSRVCQLFGLVMFYSDGRGNLRLEIVKDFALVIYG